VECVWRCSQIFDHIWHPRYTMKVGQRITATRSHQAHCSHVLKGSTVATTSNSTPCNNLECSMRNIYKLGSTTSSKFRPSTFSLSRICQFTFNLVVSRLLGLALGSNMAVSRVSPSLRVSGLWSLDSGFRCDLSSNYNGDIGKIWIPVLAAYWTERQGVCACSTVMVRHPWQRWASYCVWTGH